MDGWFNRSKDGLMVGWIDRLIDFLEGFSFY